MIRGGRCRRGPPINVVDGMRDGDRDRDRVVATAAECPRDVCDFEKRVHVAEPPTGLAPTALPCEAMGTARSRVQWLTGTCDIRYTGILTTAQKALLAWRNW